MNMISIYRQKILPSYFELDEDILEIHVQLFSILRDKLPPDRKGRVVLHLDDGATIKDLLRELDINRRVAISINDIQERNQSRKLEDGDKVKVFSSISGG